MPGTKRRCGRQPFAHSKGQLHPQTLPHPLSPQPHFSVPGNRQEAFRAQLPSSLRFGTTEMTDWLGSLEASSREAGSALIPGVWGLAASQDHSLQVAACHPSQQAVRLRPRWECGHWDPLLFVHRLCRLLESEARPPGGPALSSRSLLLHGCLHCFCETNSHAQAKGNAHCLRLKWPGTC